MNQQIALKVAIRRAGGMGALARKLGINYQTIQYWLEAGISDKWIVDVEKITRVPREQLRPDLFRGRTIVPSKELEPA